MLSFDANVLVYAVDRAAGPRHAQAKHLIASAYWKGAALAEQVLFEFLHVAVRKQKLARTEATRMVGSWAGNFPLLLPSGAVIQDTFRLLAAHSLNVWDARLLAVCGEAGCDTLLSEDMADGAQYGPVRVINPFNPANAADIAKLLKP